MKDKDRRTSGQGFREAEERGLEGERGNPRRGFLSGDETQARSLCLRKHLDLNLGLWRLGGAVVAPVPGLKGDPGPGILGVRKDESEFCGVFKEPLIFRQGLEFGGVFLAVDAFRIDEIDRLMLRVPVFAVTGQRDPFRRFADRIIMVFEIIDKKIKLMGARSVAGFDEKPLPRSAFHVAHHELESCVDRAAQELRRDLFFFSLDPDLLPTHPHQAFFSLREPAERDRDAGLPGLKVPE